MREARILRRGKGSDGKDEKRGKWTGRRTGERRMKKERKEGKIRIIKANKGKGKRREKRTGE